MIANYYNFQTKNTISIAKYLTNKILNNNADEECE